MLFRFVLLFFVIALALANSAEPSAGGAPPPPGNGTEMGPPGGNGTEGPMPPMGANGTMEEMPENGNKTGGVIDWIKSKIGK